jgi:hypothetical protein
MNSSCVTDSYVKMSSRLPRQFRYFDIVLTAVKTTHAWVVVRSIGLSKISPLSSEMWATKTRPSHEPVYPYINTRNFNCKNNNTARSSVSLSCQPGFYINSLLVCFFLAIFNDVLYANCDWSNLSTYNTYLYSMLTKLTYARFCDFVARYPEKFFQSHAMWRHSKEWFSYPTFLNTAICSWA